MKITIIHGQSHKGSTYHIARMLSEKTGGNVTEFFLPKDFNSFCTGCTVCFEKSETEAVITTPVISIKNPLSGNIYIPSACEVICDDSNSKGKVIVNEI